MLLDNSWFWTLRALCCITWILFVAGIEVC